MANTTENRLNYFRLPFLVPTTGTKELRGGLTKNNMVDCQQNPSTDS